MSDFSLFMKKNKIVKENQKYAATRSLLDENGKPVLWEFAAISTSEDEAIRTECIKQVPVPGRAGTYQQKTDAALYLAKLICACCVHPNLNNKELQDSYGCTTPEQLIRAMVDTPGEYDALGSFVQSLNGYGRTLMDEVDEAKN